MLRKLVGRFSTMRHVHCEGFGNTDVLNFKTSPIPKLRFDEVLIKVKATALNRADVLQIIENTYSQIVLKIKREGKYPPPSGCTDILGLEAAGYQLDKNGKETKRVFTILPGGGYSEYVAVNANHVIEIPDNMSFIEAAGIGETWITAFQLLKKVAQIKHGEKVLIYGGAGGVGTSAIQLCKLFHADAYVSVSSEDKLNFCKSIGAVGGVIYKDNTKIKEQILEQTDGKGVDILLDCVGASNTQLNVGLLNYDSRWIIYGLMGGHKVQNFSLAPLVAKRSSVFFSTLRNRSDNYKTDLIRDFKYQAMPWFKKYQFKPIISNVYEVNLSNQSDIEKVREAHKTMENNLNKGKIILNFV